MYLLDTNICIYIKNKKPPQVLKRFKSALKHGVFISSVTVAELQFGVYNSLHVEQNRVSLAEFLAPFEILNFGTEDAEKYGILRAKLKRSGSLIGPYDMMIAAQALAKDLVVATNNTDEFIRVEGLRLEDWK